MLPVEKREAAGEEQRQRDPNGGPIPLPSAGPRAACDETRRGRGRASPARSAMKPTQNQMLVATMWLETIQNRALVPQPALFRAQRLDCPGARHPGRLGSSLSRNDSYRDRTPSGDRDAFYQCHDAPLDALLHATPAGRHCRRTQCRGARSADSIRSHWHQAPGIDGHKRSRQ